MIGLNVAFDNTPYNTRKDTLRSLFQLSVTFIVGLLVVLSVLYPPPSIKVDKEPSAWHKGLPMLDWSSEAYVNLKKSVASFKKTLENRTSKSDPFANTFDEQQVIILSHRNGRVEGLLLRKVSEFFFAHKKSEREVRAGFIISDNRVPASILKQMRRYDLSHSVGFKVLYFSLWGFLAIAYLSYPSLKEWWTQPHGMQKRESFIDEFRHYIEIRKQTLLFRKKPLGELRASHDESYRSYLYWNEIALIGILAALLVFGVCWGLYLNPPVPRYEVAYLVESTVNK